MPTPASPPPNRCVTCGKPVSVPPEAFRAWFMQAKDQPFVALRQFLADYCTCACES